jgi:cytokinin riboside 5'-monophosphate phosphoribohydrolase
MPAETPIQNPEGVATKNTRSAKRSSFMRKIPIFPLGRCILAMVLCALPAIHAAETLSPARTQRAWVGDRLSVGVYCGATDLASPKYAAAARQLGEGLAARRWTLVWGGSKTGLMGAVAKGAKESGGRVVGVLPEFIRKWEVAYDAADEMLVVGTMQERKLLLQVRSDAFVILPGGIGTLDELGDTLDLKNLSQHRKPIILFNQDGYYDALLAFVDRTIAEKFSKNESRDHLMVASTVEEILGMLEGIERGGAALP